MTWFSNCFHPPDSAFLKQRGRANELLQMIDAGCSRKDSSLKILNVGPQSQCARLTDLVRLQRYKGWPSFNIAVQKRLFKICAYIYSLQPGCFYLPNTLRCRSEEAQKLLALCSLLHSPLPAVVLSSACLCLLSLGHLLCSSSPHLTPGRRRHHLWGIGWLCPMMQTDRGQKRSLIQEDITERHLSGWEGNCKEAKWGSTETENLWLRLPGTTFKLSQAGGRCSFFCPTSRHSIRHIRRQLPLFLPQEGISLETNLPLRTIDSISFVPLATDSKHNQVEWSLYAVATIIINQCTETTINYSYKQLEVHRKQNTYLTKYVEGQTSRINDIETTENWKQR